LDAASGGAADLDSVPQETDDRCELLGAQLGGVAAVRGCDDDLDSGSALGGLADAADEVGFEIDTVLVPGMGVGHEPPFVRTGSRVG
jgi:hypothetical protein